MIVTEILGNVHDVSEPAELSIDSVLFDNESRLKRVQRVTSEGGTEIGLRFDTDFRELHDGDILWREGDSLIVAKIDPTDVLVIKPGSIKEALTVAHSLGNRHLQAQFFEDEAGFTGSVMVVRYDHTVEHFLDHMETNYERGQYVMPKAFRHAEHTH
ncbi:MULTISPECIES: urease accessory protein UreE [Corynebacterium]|uniref:Urease accessory protein UreE n=2 Tax=Corynebacterium glucuronolyticum TaxID=39791 RepID=A0A7T4EEM4_9CORY|nr:MULTISPECIES: urease accessory protein UreE [Corynebacterium]EEI27379.1 urease accessory protein UreE domain protein [Corynebacterium glucuronolyticum ATCC 51867]EEI62786.1 urease accessory protein UreE domain protein [Corynebacterium glucuronolyticum ATCC 51866]MCT1441655.1 urease accessory protein UreE [Corynebacterium glucuronolyticum]OFO42938.1 Urease accessory protein UreE [Corynebacterium sp. HMSC073D01]QQB45969.1 urease accessory protein UreE [Corynebacterium glucuronolyticum]